MLGAIIKRVGSPSGSRALEKVLNSAYASAPRAVVKPGGAMLSPCWRVPAVRLTRHRTGQRSELYRQVNEQQRPDINTGQTEHCSVAIRWQIWKWCAKSPEAGLAQW